MRKVLDGYGNSGAFLTVQKYDIKKRPINWDLNKGL